MSVWRKGMEGRWQGTRPLRRGLAASLTLALGWGVLLAMAANQGPVYTVPQVLSGLSHDPRAWAGRTALVWGTALEIVPGCPRGRWCVAGLYKPETPRPGPILLLEPEPPNPVAARLRDMPIVRRLLPEPQRLRWQTPATYRLHFQVVPGMTCGGSPCINTLLVDAVT